jgi:hypothetical protein
MAHATVGYLFNGNPENGGEGLLLGLNRCQAFKVAQRSYKGKGGSKITKGDCLLTDCNVTGLEVELQAPQGPYTNVLDLQVFPAMSKKHSELLQVYNNTEASVERIWKVAKEIWYSISSSMVARAFLLAYRIMAKIIETNGDTEWLSHGAPHCHVRRDYVDTDRGVMKVSDVTTIEENDPPASASY